MTLYRSSDEAIVGGVCAGLAHAFDLNRIGLRAVVLVSSLLLTGLPALLYLALWAVLKARPTGGFSGFRRGF